jgi:glutamine amidotransferase
MKPVIVVNTGLCNLDSICRALQECGGSPEIAAEGAAVKAERIVLPGVGAFASAMTQLRRTGLDAAVRERVLGDGVPFLGICLGMQLAAAEGEEGGASAGLGLIPGRVTRLEPQGGDRVPHIGWNEVAQRANATLFTGLAPGTDFYFVHSFHLRCPDDVVAASTPYCGGFVSAVERQNVFGVQFHPEKSQTAGFDVLRAFLRV